MGTKEFIFVVWLGLMGFAMLPPQHVWAILEQQIELEGSVAQERRSAQERASAQGRLGTQEEPSQREDERGVAVAVPNWADLEETLQNAASDSEKLEMIYEFAIRGRGVDHRLVYTRLQAMQVGPDAQPLQQAILASLMARDMAGSRNRPLLQRDRNEAAANAPPSIAQSDRSRNMAGSVVSEARPSPSRMDAPARESSSSQMDTPGRESSSSQMDTPGRESSSSQMDTPTREPALSENGPTPTSNPINPSKKPPSPAPRTVSDNGLETPVYYAKKAAALYLGANETEKYLVEQLFTAMQYRRTRSFVEAEQVIFESIEVAKSYPTDSDLLAALYSSAGSIYSMTLAFDLAETMFSEAAYLSGDPEMECIHMNSRANALNRMRRSDDVPTILQPCMELEILNPDLQSTIQMTVSNALLVLEDTVQAISYIDNSLQLLSVNAVDQRAGRLSQMGRLLIGIDDIERATEVASRLQGQSAGVLRPNTRFPVDTFLMEYFLKTGELNRALEVSERYLSRLPVPINHPLVGPVHELRSKIFSRLGESEKALESSNLHIEQMKWVGQQQDRMEEANASVRLQLRKIQAAADRSVLQERSASRRALLFFLFAVMGGIVALVLLQRYRKSKREVESYSKQLTKAEEETARLRKRIDERQKNRSEEALREDSQRIRFSRNLQISPSSISHLESQGNYVRILPVGYDKPELQERMTLKYCEGLLPADLFMRVHRSYIINVTQIDRVDGERIFMKNGDEIPISRAVKSQLLEV